ncbi:glutamyl-tRNA synthetase [alpha proteobacterium AAP81b]|nr:glutamyl-tRNA synthetase [alpha proteobacterium AAP81b]
MTYATRFAPSPTGRLHLGHALSALTARTRADAAGGTLRLRIEDIDRTRCRPEFEAAIFEDLAWLGIAIDGAVMRQSDRGAAYDAALDRLRVLGVVYPCTCTRADIAAAAGAPHGPAGALYPGTCRGRRGTDRADAAWRLDTAAAAALTGPLVLIDTAHGTMPVDPGRLGDLVVARADIGTAYPLAVVVDDAAQGITEVVRGDDLRDAAHPQRLLQALLGLPEPRYHHHPLIHGLDGKRLAKRDRAATLAALRDEGVAPATIVESLRKGDWLGLLR